jgi:hypothetical protein
MMRKYAISAVIAAALGSALTVSAADVAAAEVPSCAPKFDPHHHHHYPPKSKCDEKTHSETNILMIGSTFGSIPGFEQCKCSGRPNEGLWLW